jgi:hypothetical protein
MPLTKEDRIELLKRAREAKANKKAIKEEETDNEEEPVVNVPTPPEPEKPAKKKTGRKPKEIVPLPIPVEVVHIEEPVEPVKKSLPIKWLKKGAETPKVCCNKVSKEEYVIDDDKPQVFEEKIVVPPQKEIKKVRKVRASTPANTLDLTDKPRDIVEVINDLSQDNAKYLPKIKPPPSAPISIVNNKIRLFDY